MNLTNIRMNMYPRAGSHGFKKKTPPNYERQKMRFLGLIFLNLRSGFLLNVLIRQIVVVYDRVRHRHDHVEQGRFLVC